MTQRYFPRTILALALLMMATGLVQAQPFDNQQVIEETFEISKDGTLFLDSDIGAVVVEGTRSSDVHVKVYKGTNRMRAGRAEDVLDRFELSFNESGNRVEIIGDYDRPRGRWGDNGLRVKFEIEVPTDINVVLETAGGSISVDNIEGDAEVKTAGGALRLSSIDGEVNAHTSGGSITAEDLGGESILRTSGGSIQASDIGGSLDVNTSGGSIKIESVDGPVHARTSGGSITLMEIAGAVQAKTSGGSIKAEVLGPIREDMDLQTSGGTVTLTMDEGIKADLDAKSSGGSVSVDFPVTIQGEIKKTHVQGEINGGGPMLTLRSSGGGIRIREN